MTTNSAPTQANSASLSWFQNTVIFSKMIKLSHSIFALPFALAAAFLASEGWPDGLILFKIVLACFFARTLAMAFNRWADAKIDAENPRTAIREIPQGLLRRSTVGWITIVFSILFVLTSYWINLLAFYLSPIALIVLLGYSLLKRVTSNTHLFLGIALGLSPVGAWIAIKNEFALLPIVLGFAVACWTAGFDIIYSCQDADYDRKVGLHSIPSKVGIKNALWISRLLHLATVGLLISVGMIGELGTYYYIGVGIVSAILTYEQCLVKPNDLSKVNLAFFTLNGIVSMVFMTTVILDLFN